MVAFLNTFTLLMGLLQRVLSPASSSYSSLNCCSGLNFFLVQYSSNLETLPVALSEYVYANKIHKTKVPQSRDLLNYMKILCGNNMGAFFLMFLP